MTGQLRSARVTAVLLAIFVCATIAIGTVTQAKVELPSDTEGDAELGAATRAVIGERNGPTVAAVVTRRSTTVSRLGSRPEDEYEIGSLSKLFTAELLARAVAAGEVNLNTRLGALLPVTGDVGDVTLEELATHTSGLSLWGNTGPRPKQKLRQTLFAANPWNVSRRELLTWASGDPLTSRGQYRYSNIGYGLLGQALAEATDMTYEQLLNGQIIEPMALSSTRIGTADLTDTRRGASRTGRRVKPWNLGQLAPSGGIRSTSADMTTWVRAVLDSATPSGQAFDALTRSDNAIGWDVGPGGVRSKWGMTGGFASSIAISADRSCGVLVLTSSGVGIKNAARDLLDQCP